VRIAQRAERVELLHLKMLKGRDISRNQDALAARFLFDFERKRPSCGTAVGR